MHPITRITAESAELTNPVNWHALVQDAARASQIPMLEAHLATLPLTPVVAARRAQLLGRTRQFAAALELLAPFSEPLPCAQAALLLMAYPDLDSSARVAAMLVDWVSHSLVDIEAAYRLHHARALALKELVRLDEARSAFRAAEILSEALGLHHVRLVVQLELVGLDVQDNRYGGVAERFSDLADVAGAMGLELLHRRSLEGLYWTTLVLGGDLSAVAARFPAGAQGAWRALAALAAGDDIDLPDSAADAELLVVAQMWRQTCTARIHLLHADVRGAVRAQARAPMDAMPTMPLYRALYLAARALMRLYAGDPLGAQADMHAMPNETLPIERALKAVVAMQILVTGVRVPESTQYPLDRAARDLAMTLKGLPAEARYAAVARLGRLTAGAIGLFARSSYSDDFPEVHEWLEREVIQVDATGAASLNGERLREWPRAFVRLLDDVMLGRHLQDSEDRTVRRYRTAMRETGRHVVFDVGVQRAIDRAVHAMEPFERLSWPDL
ncbi:hypothetical protein [Deinococcus sp. PEB2-67]